MMSKNPKLIPSFSLFAAMVVALASLTALGAAAAKPNKPIVVLGDGPRAVNVEGRDCMFLLNVSDQDTAALEGIGWTWQKFEAMREDQGRRVLERLHQAARQA